MAASRRALALACVSCACMITGAAYAGLPSGPAPAAAAAISLPVTAPTTPAVTDSAPSLPVGYGEPRPHPVLVATGTHAAHQHHMAVVAAAATPTTPAPTPSATTLPSTATAPVQTSAPAPEPTASTPTASPQAGPGSGAGAELLNKALSMQGVPYVYGGDTPGGFDCSGLVYWAAQQFGISMPRDTYSMLAQGVSSGLLVQVSEPSYGDLAFFGSGHVEFYVHAGETFGAQSPGTVVGYHPYGGGYAPSAFYRVT